MYLIVGTNSKSLFRILFYNSFKVKKKSASVYISLTQQVITHRLTVLLGFFFAFQLIKPD